MIDKNKEKIGPLDQFIKDNNISPTNEPDKQEYKRGGSLDNFCKENKIDVSNSYYDINHNLDRYLAKNGISCSNEPYTPHKKFSLDSDLAKNGDDVSNNVDPPFVSENFDLKKYIENLQKLEEITSDIDDPEAKINYLLKDRKGVGIISTENIGLVVAPPKSGKSTFVAILIASVLGCGKQFGFYAQKKDAKVLHIDTEQGEAHHQRNMKYIYQMCTSYRMPKDDFRKRYKAIRARKFRDGGLREITETAIRYHKPDFVVIDGVAQMTPDINDQGIGAKINDFLQNLSETYKCHIMCVIHTPKQKNNEDDWSEFVPKGALGTMLWQGVSDRFTCIKREADKETSKQHFVVRHDGRDENIEKFVFKRDPEKNGLPIPYFEPNVKDPKENIRNAIKQFFSKNGNKALQKGELIKEITTLNLGYGKTTLENKWDEIIEPIKDELYIIKNGKSILIKLKDPQDPEQTEFNPIAEPDQTPEDPPF